MRRIRHLFSVLMLVFLFPVNIHAHVIIFYRYKPLIYEVSHRSLVIYDKENQKVGLIPQIGFRGEPQDFCIVVPTPSAPRLNTVTMDVFYEVEALTSSIRRERGSGCLFSEDILGGADEEAVAPKDIDIISEQSVGMFDAVTLSAADPDALVNWLQENNYNYSVQDEETIDYYIQKGWVFTAMKIDISSASGMSEDRRYNINPVLFRYSANSLVYPIRLASINAGDRTDIVTYILSDSKMTFPGARIQYANRINDKELEEILDRYPAFGGLIGRQRYLTKLKRTFSIMEMDMDIEIVSAPNNEEFRKVIYYGISPATDFIPLGIVAILFLAFRALTKERSKGQRAKG